MTKDTKNKINPLESNINHMLYLSRQLLVYFWRFGCHRATFALVLSLSHNSPLTIIRILCQEWKCQIEIQPRLKMSSPDHENVYFSQSKYRSALFWTVSKTPPPVSHCTSWDTVRHPRLVSQDTPSSPTLQHFFDKWTDGFLPERLMDLCRRKSGFPDRLQPGAGSKDRIHEILTKADQSRSQAAWTFGRWFSHDPSKVCPRFAAKSVLVLFL